MKIVGWGAAVFLSLPLSQSTAQAQWDGSGFSADFHQSFNVGGQPEQQGRFFLDSEGMRMEMTEEGRAVVSIMRFQENDMLLLIPDQKKYMTLPASMITQDGSRLEAKFAGACAEYRVSERIGSETVNGSDTEIWRCEQSRNDESDAEVWFAPDLGAPIRVVSEDGNRFELSNIDVGDQPSGLFQPPSDFKPMSIQDMMQLNQ